jgi:two-component system response regulator GlrR
MMPDRLAIFVVDDDPVFAESPCAMLHGMGHGATMFENANAARDGLSARQPDIVLLDCGLEGLSELTLRNRLQSRHPPIPVIIVSAPRWDAHHQIMRAYGAADVLEKPVTATELAGAITRALTAESS